MGDGSDVCFDNLQVSFTRTQDMKRTTSSEKLTKDKVFSNFPPKKWPLILHFGKLIDGYQRPRQEGGSQKLDTTPRQYGLWGLRTSPFHGSEVAVHLSSSSPWFVRVVVIGCHIGTKLSKLLACD